MERFALAAAVVLGFALTAALCSLFVPLRRVLERREQNQQPVQSEQPRPAPLRAPLWGGLCAAAGTVAAVGVGWLAACVGQPELLGSEGRLMTRLLTALAGSLAFGAVGFAEDLARMRSPAALGLRRDVRLLLEALAAAFVLLLLRAAGCLPRGLGVPGLAVLPAALAGALVALGLWAFPPARLGVGCCGSLLAAGAIGCIPLSLDMTSLTVPLALPFWAAGGLWAAQLLGAKRTGKPLRCWVKKHKMSPETVFLCSFALSAVGYVLALALLRWC